MFKTNRKKTGDRFNFDKQLDLQLRSIKQDPLNKLPIGNRNQQIADIIDEAVQGLQHHNDQNYEDFVFSKLKTEKQICKKINEMELLEIDGESQIQQKNRERQVFDEGRSRKQNKKNVSSSIWNLSTNPDVIELLKNGFSNYTEEQTISIIQFAKQGINFYIGKTAKDSQLQQIIQLMQNDVTTTNSAVVSLNALQILAKKIMLQHYFIQKIVEAKTKIKIREFEKKNKVLVLQIGERQENLLKKQEIVQQKYQQIRVRQLQTISKEKSLTAKQKQLNLREKQIKKSIEEKCSKLQQMYLIQVSQKLKEGETKLTQLQRSIKYKIQILERRAETLRNLRNQQLDSKNKKVVGQNQARIKLRKIQKQMDVLQKNHQIEIQKYQAEEAQFLKNISILDDKLNKNQKKNKKMKDKIIELQEEINNIKSKYHQLEEQNKLQKNNQINDKLINVATQDKHSTSKTTRSQKSKRKLKSNQLQPILAIYELLLKYSQFTQQKSQSIELSSQLYKNIPTILPNLISLLCLGSDDDDQCNSNQPHFLTLNLNIALIRGHFSYLMHQRSHLLQQNDTDTNNQYISPLFKPKQLIFSNDIAQLLKLPLKTVTKISIFLLLLPIFQWQKCNTNFIPKVLQQIIEQIQNNHQQNIVVVSQINAVTSIQFIFFLCHKFVGELPDYFKTSAIQTNLKSGLLNGIAVTDFILGLSKRQSLFSLNSLTQTHLQQILLQTFINQLKTILSIHSSTPKSKPTNKQLLFTNLQYSQQLIQKLSILLQRIYYNCQSATCPHVEAKQLNQLHLQLIQINKYNRNRHGLVLANLKSILQMISNSF